jgi:hypothetical protein
MSLSHGSLMSATGLNFLRATGLDFANLGFYTTLLVGCKIRAMLSNQDHDSARTNSSLIEALGCYPLAVLYSTYLSSSHATATTLICTT